MKLNELYGSFWKVGASRMHESGLVNEYYSFMATDVIVVQDGPEDIWIR